MKHDRERLQDQAVEKAGELTLVGVAAGARNPAGFCEVTFSDGSVVMMTAAQFDAIRRRE